MGLGQIKFVQPIEPPSPSRQTGEGAGYQSKRGRLKTCFQFSDDLLATSTLPVFKLS